MPAPLALITAKTPAETFPGAKAEHDPEWYWNAVADTIGTSIRQSGVNSREIKGVSVGALSPACIIDMIGSRLPEEIVRMWLHSCPTKKSGSVPQP
jgi:ribulose kinase